MATYITKCIICKKEFIAERSDADVCGSACRQKKYRLNNKRKALLSKRNEAQPRKILNQSTVNSLILPGQQKVKDPVSEVVNKISHDSGKDISECKRPDGEHLYIETDLWILLARICQTVIHEDSGNFISKLKTNMSTDELIRDFERRFECGFEDVKRANPKIQPGKTNKDNYLISSKYASLKYSREISK